MLGYSEPQNEADSLLGRELHALIRFDARMERKSKAAWLLDHGQYFTPGALPNGYERGDARECFYNAQQLVFDHEDLVHAEGWALSSETSLGVVRHGWCVTEKGVAVDPTWDEPGSSYFGVLFDREYTTNRFKKDLFELQEIAPFITPELFCSTDFSWKLSAS